MRGVELASAAVHMSTLTWEDALGAEVPAVHLSHLLNITLPSVHVPHSICKVCAVPLVEESKLVCDARRDELLDEGQGLCELLQIIQQGVLESVKEDLPDAGRGKELFFEGQEDAIESRNPECWHLILDHRTQGGGHRIQNSHLILQSSIAQVGLENPCPDLPVSDCSVLIV